MPEVTISARSDLKILQQLIPTMIFGGKKNKDWEDQYDEYYTQSDPEYGRHVKPLLWVHAGILLTLAGVFLAIVGAVAGFTMVEKSLKALCSPVGLAWIILGLIVYFSLVYKAGWTAVAAFVCWMSLTVGGNYFVASFLVSGLESEFTASDPLEGEPFDVVIVLGGGTNMTPNGNSQLAEFGDRVMTVARMYHRGKTKMIISTGMQKYKAVESDLHPNEETIAILKDLKVPAEDLRMLGGINTQEEMQQIRKWLDTTENSEKLKLGIATSAWHLPRAMTLAKANEINATAIPANFRTQPYAPNPSIVIPSASNLKTTAEMIHERLGRMMGR